MYITKWYIVPCPRTVTVQGTLSRTQNQYNVGAKRQYCVAPWPVLAALVTWRIRQVPYQYPRGKLVLMNQCVGQQLRI